jgi:AmmeMemoRadiSam system protein B
MDYPKLRGVEAFPVTVSGGKALCLRDPTGLSEKLTFIPYDAFFVVSLFDGKHSVLDIKAAYMRKFGQMLFSEDLDRIIDQLDENLLLESDRFEAFKRERTEAFKRSPVRKPAHAGKSYETNAEELAKRISAFFDAPDGAGKPAAAPREATLRAIIAPHIDFNRGGPCFSWAYKEVAERSGATLFVILGTAHVPTSAPFVLTKKDFETPFGIVRTDAAFVDSLQQGSDLDFFHDEFAHKMEHSVEFQVAFLHYLFAGKKDFRIVPILCGSLNECIEKGTSPEDLPAVSHFVASLKRALISASGEALVIAGADLAHIGLRFGDQAAPSKTFLREIEGKDREMLAFAEDVDALGFFGYVQREGDHRRICGLPSIYALLASTDASRGELLSYQQSSDDGSGSTVTFASMGFYA